MKPTIPGLCAALMLMAIGSSAFAQVDPQWTTYELWTSSEKIQGVMFADVDPDRAGTEAVCVTVSGRVVVGGLEAARKPWSQIIYQHPVKLQSLIWQDLDPSIPGKELYVGGGGAKVEGEIVQLKKIKGNWQARSVWTGDGYVHAMARLAGRTAKEPARLVAPCYAGKVYILTPSKSTPWRGEVIYSQVLDGDSNNVKFKDVAIGKIGGLGPRTVTVSSLDGRITALDPDHPGANTRIHYEAGGVARITLASDGTLYGACNNGNVLHMAYKGKAWVCDTLYHDTSNLRGVKIGTFRTSQGTAKLATHGYGKVVRALLQLPHAGVRRSNVVATRTRGGMAAPPKDPTLDSVELFVDADMAHAIDAADVIKGNGSDELLIGGYSGELTIVAHR